MNSAKIALLLFITVSFSSIGQNQPYLISPDTNKKWKVQAELSDEFDSSTIDWNKKWLFNSNLPNVNAWKWNNEDNVVIVNNTAEIKMCHNADNIPVNGTYFNSGILKSKETFTTGFVEVRMKGATINVPGMDNGRGVCPSFWLYSDFDRNVEEGETVYSEIDVVELQQFDFFKGEQDDIFDMDLNLHMVIKENGKDVWYRPKQKVDTQKNHYTASFDPRLEFHIYGCEVTKKEITWYIDGVKVASKPNEHWNRPMNVTMSLGLRVPFVKFMNNRFEAVDPTLDERAKLQLAGMPTSMSVDYVRVWK
ncbi:family 16 glycosylhydrolase [Flavobacterium sp.]|uniref:family 16 glycosylhydrolase n=1 Tax=Flavobacterium sp. TaxID=239 RepID=UPI003C6AD7BF